MSSPGAAEGLTHEQRPGLDVLDSPGAGSAAIRGSALRLVGYALGVLVGVGGMALLFRHLGVRDSGEYVTVIALVALFGGIADGGLSVIGVRELAARTGADREAFFRNLLGVRVASILAGIAAATLFAAIAGYGRVLVLAVVLAGLGFLLQTTQLTLAAPLMKDLRLGWVAALDLLRHVVATVAVAVLVVLGATLLPFFAVTIVASLVVLVLTARLLGGDVSTRPAFDLDQWRDVGREALPFAAAFAVGSIYFRFAVILVSLLSTGDETGFFGASFRIVEVLLVVPQLAIGAAFPILARAAASDHDRFVYGVRKLFEASLVFGGWIAICVTVAAPLAIDVVAGPEFEPAVRVLQIQGIALFASFVAALWGYALLSMRRHLELVVMSAIPLAVTGVLAVPLVLEHGARGAAVATAIGEVTMALIGGALLMRSAGFAPVTTGVFPRVALAGAAAVGVALIPGLPAVADLVLASLAYFAVLLAVKGIPTELLAELRGLRPSAAR